MRVAAGSVDQSVVIRIVDSTDGTPEEGVTSASGGLALWYWRMGGTVVALTESDLTNLDSAHSDGGMKHADDGYYRVDIPDAAFATGADRVTIGGAVTGMVVIGTVVEIGPVVANATQLSGDAAAADNAEAFFDGTGYAGTNNVIPTVTTVNGLAADVITAASIANGAIDAATFAAGALDAVWSVTARTLTAFGFSVTVGTNSDKTGYALSSAGIQAIWDALTSALTTVGSIGKLLVDNIDATISSRLASASYTAPPTAADIRSAVGLASANLDAQLGAIDDAVDTEVAQTLAAVDTEVAAIKAVTDALTVLGATRLGLSAATMIPGTAIAGTLSTTQMTTDLTEATNDHYNGRLIVWTSGVLVGQYSRITDYDGTSKMLTFVAITEAPSIGDTFMIV